MKRFIKYQGSKGHFIQLFNDLTSHLNASTYIEPFIGSGSIFFNLKKQYDRYIINDLNPHVISIYQAIKSIEYDQLLDAKNFIFKEFGDIKNNKNSYYEFRDFYNDNYHFTDSINKGLYLYFLANSCINSMLRFGPNGMNQSYGNRLYIMDNETFIHCKSILNRSEIYNLDYVNVMESDSLIFLDPPYFERPTSYSNNFTKNDLLNFMDVIRNVNSYIVYTDIYSEFIDKTLDWDYLKTKVITNTSPGKLNDKYQEVCFFNFDRPNKRLF